jgi:hypothetical protein
VLVLAFREGEEVKDMALIDPVLGMKLVILFGVTNVLCMLAAFFTCRCLVGVKFVNEMLKRQWYRWVFDHHCWYWRLFFLSVIIHIALVLMTFGIPKF